MTLLIIIELNYLLDEELLLEYEEREDEVPLEYEEREEELPLEYDEREEEELYELLGRLYEEELL